MSDFCYEKITSSRLKDVVLFFNQERQFNYKDNYFYKKYKADKNSNFISIICSSKNEIISHSAVTPQIFSNKNNVNFNVLSGEVGDTLTHKSYRRMGLFKNVNERIIHEAKNSNYSFLYRFPNPSTKNGLLKHLGYKEKESFYKFKFSCFTLIPTIKILNKFKLFKIRTLYGKLISYLSFSSKLVFESSLWDQGFNCIKHDKDFFKYKENNDNFKINFLGDKYWFKFQDGIIIGDFSIKKKRYFLLKLRILCFLIGVHEVQFMICKDTKEYNFLSKFSKPSVHISVCYHDLNHEKFNISNYKFTYADVDTF